MSRLPETLTQSLVKAEESDMLLKKIVGTLTKKENEKELYFNHIFHWSLRAKRIFG